MFNFTQTQAFTQTIRCLLKTVIVLSSFALFSTTTLASGSFGGNSNFNGHNSYNLGKSVFHKKIICPTCPESSLKMTKSSAVELINKLTEKTGFADNLSDKNRLATIEYLTKRFKIN